MQRRAVAAVLRMQRAARKQIVWQRKRRQPEASIPSACVQVSSGVLRFKAGSVCGLTCRCCTQLLAVCAG